MRAGVKDVTEKDEFEKNFCRILADAWNHRLTRHDLERELLQEVRLAWTRGWLKGQEDASE